MSYVDAFFDKTNEEIKVVERLPNGKRNYKSFPANYMFYVPDSNGKFRSTKGEPLSQIKCRNNAEFHKELAINASKKIYEGDINLVVRCLSENYIKKTLPKLNVAYWDIETDWCPTRGYASPDDPFLSITAIAVHLQWTDTLICLSIPPKGMTIEQARAEVEEFPNTIVFEEEKEMLDTFLTLIEDADLISGWNSTGFDLPYTVNRVAKLLGKDATRRFCLWDQLPKKREYEKFGKIGNTYELVGRVHIDSLDLYTKYTFEERASYRLDAIAEYELGDHKTQYDGTLDQLYNNDFKKFIEYNRQDTALLDKLDKKLHFIDLLNGRSHECTVLIPAAMGTVAATEQSIINEAHRLDQIVPNRLPKPANTQAAGAYVAYPVKGLHDWVGSLDINSLYPSVIRALNMSNECIVGQLRPIETDAFINAALAKKLKFAEAWEGKFSTHEFEHVILQDDEDVTIDWEDGGSDTLTGAQAYQLIYESGKKWCLSANGTIFSYEKEGIIPGLLARWYSSRQEIQALERNARDTGDTVKQAEYYLQQQLLKLALNSLYGALLNSGCRFFDKRLGQSTTLTGRKIVQHMTAEVNREITGEYNYLGKSIIYNDTDSVYFSAYPTLKDEITTGDIPWTKEDIIEYYDSICDVVNDTFADFMLSEFHCPKSRGSVIKAGREIVASKALMITKKRYAAMYFDNDGKRTDINGKPGKMKAMGLDLRRSDTPGYIQDFLSEVLTQVLTDVPLSDTLAYITEFRTEFKKKSPWEKGNPKRANNVVAFQAKSDAVGKSIIPGHVTASHNWNALIRMNKDIHTSKIIDGTKVVVCALKPNQMGFKTVAYPVDELRLPTWFLELPFDANVMEQKLIDDKLDNLIGVLNWDISDTKLDTNFSSLFSF